MMSAYRLFYKSSYRGDFWWVSRKGFLIQRFTEMQDRIGVTKTSSSLTIPVRYQKEVFEDMQKQWPQFGNILYISGSLGKTKICKRFGKKN